VNSISVISWCCLKVIAEVAPFLCSAAWILRRLSEPLLNVALRPRYDSIRTLSIEHRSSYEAHARRNHTAEHHRASWTLNFDFDLHTFLSTRRTSKNSFSG